MRLAAGILVVLVSVWMVRRGYRRGAAYILMGFCPLVAMIATMGALDYFGLLRLGGVVVGASLAAGAALGAFLIVRGVLIPLRKKRTADAGWLDRAGGAVLGLFLASFLCLIVAEVGSVIVFSVTMSAPDERLNPLDASDADASRWIDSLSDFCSATADFNAAGLLRHVPYAGQYARQMRSLIKILNAPREDLALVAEKRGLLDLTSIPEVRMALTDPDYQTLLVRVRQGDIKALYQAAESPITHELFACRGLRQFTEKLKLSDLLEDIESVKASRNPTGTREVAGQ